MLVCISGSQGTGKTTVINDLKITHSIITRKTARSVLKDDNIKLQDVYADYNSIVKFQDVLLERKISDEKKAISSDSIVFTERSYLDLLTYAILHVGHIMEYSGWLNEYAERCIQLHKQYHRVIYLSGGKFQIENDGVRVSNKFYANAVNIHLYHLIQRYTNATELKVIESIDHNVRIKQILEFIG